MLLRAIIIGVFLAILAGAVVLFSTAGMVVETEEVTHSIFDPDALPNPSTDTIETTANMADETVADLNQLDVQNEQPTSKKQKRSQAKKAKATPEATNEATPEATPEATNEATNEATPEATNEAKTTRAVVKAVNETEIAERRRIKRLYKMALVEAKKLQVEDMRNAALLEIIDHALDRDDFAQAKRVLGELSTPELRDVVRAEIGEGLADNGEGQAAFEILGELEVDHLTARTRLDIITALMATRAERAERAEQAASAP